MDKCFLSFSFASQQDRLLVGHVEALFESHDIRAVTGEYLGGARLTAEIEKRIGECDGLVALLTARESDQATNDFSLWVQNELVIARAKQLPAIALIERTLNVGGAYADNERIDYDPSAPAPALVKLSQTLGHWRRSSGRWVKVNLQPDDFARRLGRNGGSCEYRLSRLRDAWQSDWREARVRQETGGTFAYLSGVHDDWLIELRANLGGERWSCPATQQQLMAKLERQ